MMEPTVLPRSEHTISRRDIDPDALKVLYRLREHGYVAYLVGGSVRDLMLGRRPKDFDIGTSAHPYEIKKLFRNCWIIGRRFRLAHVKFGLKTIEVATFRRQVADLPGEPADTPDAPAAEQTSAIADNVAFIHRDNSFGTPEEDAFRRDFTVNGMFYDIASFSVIDYVGGLDDLTRRVIRSIGDPNVRFVEDPVRMLRAVVMASRLDFQLDPDVIAAIERHRELIRHASPARMIEEYYKILRSGAAAKTFHALDETGLLELVTPELAGAGERFYESLISLDAWRRQHPEIPASLTNPILVGALVGPLGLLPAEAPPPRPARPAPPGKRIREPLSERVSIGMLPLARRDVDGFRHITMLVPRLHEQALSVRQQRSIVHRPAFDETLTWLEIFGTDPDLIEVWKEQKAEHGSAAPHEHEPGGGPGGPPSTDRRRRRRRRRGGSRNRRGPAPQ
ncbi:MAG TPA: polynucleotide adenylyltransferase PcnB [Vicinamibacterales bacterium]|nr:polynucleotide adenylyltransferase PcnB [Vicinamibacterales bacterium]